METKVSNFATLQELSLTQDGLVLLGAGGDLQEWIDGITKMLKDEDIASDAFEVTGAYKVTTIGGRADLLLLFDWSTVTVGKLAIWRIAFGDCSWLSDYIPNYANQHSSNS